MIFIPTPGRSICQPIGLLHINYYCNAEHQCKILRPQPWNTPLDDRDPEQFLMVLVNYLNVRTNWQSTSFCDNTWSIYGTLGAMVGEGECQGSKTTSRNKYAAYLHVVQSFPSIIRHLITLRYMFHGSKACDKDAIVENHARGSRLTMQKTRSVRNRPVMDPAKFVRWQVVCIYKGHVRTRSYMIYVILISNVSRNECSVIQAFPSPPSKNYTASSYRDDDAHFKKRFERVL